MISLRGVGSLRDSQMIHVCNAAFRHLIFYVFKFFVLSLTL